MMATRLNSNQPLWKNDKNRHSSVSSHVSKSDGDLKSQRVKRTKPEWQNRPRSMTSETNVFDNLSTSTGFVEMDMHNAVTTYLPRTNTPLDFNAVYETSNDVKRIRRLSSGRNRSVTPSRGRQVASFMGSVDLSMDGRQKNHFIETQKVYDVDREHKMRQRELVSKYSTSRSRYIQEQLREQREAARQRVKKENQILSQLKKMRREFQLEKEWRVRCQYVTTRVLEHERMDRELYGLPLNVQADFFPKKRKPKRLVTINKNIPKETSRYQNKSVQTVPNLYGINYPTIEPRLKPPSFSWKNKRKMGNLLLHAFVNQKILLLTQSFKVLIIVERQLSRYQVTKICCRMKI